MGRVQKLEGGAFKRQNMKGNDSTDQGKQNKQQNIQINHAT